MRRAPTSTEEFERRPKTARKSEIDTKTKLLNAAERLFSDKGIEAVSHRDIALAAAVNLAALNYHFRSRQTFIRAVIKRRVEPINAHRLAALARAERQMGVRLKMGEMWMRLFFDLDLTAYNAVRLRTCPLLPRSQPASANSPPNWLNLNLCAAARFPSAPSSAARRAALAPAIPRLATVLTKA